MNFSKQLAYKKVMSRMEWFRDLKLIYNKILNEEDILTSIDKSLILTEINSIVPKLDLKDPEEYYSKSKVQAFSLTEILDHINALEDQKINFDQLIDSLIYLSIEKKRKEKAVVKENFKSLVKPIQIPDPRLKDTKLDSNHPIKVFLDPSADVDLSFPEHKIATYPNLNNYYNLVHLSLAGNNINTTQYPFPATLKVLNLSSNRISQFKLESSLNNLLLLNLTSNQINLFSTNHIKNIKELFLANNCIDNINTFSHLNQLYLLDCSYNDIESFEDIAGLVISKHLGVLKLRGNPVSSKSNYEQAVPSLLPRIYNLDPLNIIQMSNFQSLGSLPYLPIKNVLEDSDEKLVESNKSNLCNIKSEKILLNKRKSAPDTPKSHRNYQTQGNKLSLTPSGPTKTSPKVARSFSQPRIENFSNSNASLQSFNEETTRKPSKIDFNSSIMDIAENRIKVFQSNTRSRSSISLVSNETIQNNQRKQYGNPIAAMMIGPPAVQGPKLKIPAKAPVFFTVDLSNKHKFK